jgi:hypothetical protein
VDGGPSVRAPGTDDPNSTFRKQAKSKQARELRANAALARLEQNTRPAAAKEEESETEVEEDSSDEEESEEADGFLVDDFFDFHDDQDDDRGQPAKSSKGAARAGDDEDARQAQTKASKETAGQRRTRLDKGVKPEDRSDFRAEWDNWLSTKRGSDGQGNRDSLSRDSNDGLPDLDETDEEDQPLSRSLPVSQAQDDKKGVKPSGRSGRRFIDLTDDPPIQTKANEWCASSEWPSVCQTPSDLVFCVPRSCAACTIINHADYGRCSVCGIRRGRTVSADDPSLSVIT